MESKIEIEVYMNDGVQMFVAKVYNYTINELENPIQEEVLKIEGTDLDSILETIKKQIQQ